MGSFSFGDGEGKGHTGKGKGQCHEIVIKYANTETGNARTAHMAYIGVEDVKNECNSSRRFSLFKVHVILYFFCVLYWFSYLFPRFGWKFGYKLSICFLNDLLIMKTFSSFFIS